MKVCPKFECLLYKEDFCIKYEGCEGCPYYCSCDNCSRQSAIVSGYVVSCDLKELPVVCRACSKREEPNFSVANVCIDCELKNVSL